MSNVVASERRRVGLQLQPERSQLGVPRGGVADVGRRAAPDLEESDSSAWWEHLIDGLADEWLGETRGPSDQISLLICQREPSLLPEARRRLDDEMVVQASDLLDEGGRRIAFGASEAFRQHAAKTVSFRSSAQHSE